MTVYNKLVLQRLICKDCDISADMRVDPDDKTNWPLHKCSKTHAAEPFSTVIGVPKEPIREFPAESEPRRKPKPPDLSYLRVIG